MAWLGVLMFLGVGFICGGAFVWWVDGAVVRTMRDNARKTAADNQRLRARNQEILDAIRTDYERRVTRHTDGAR
jgi:hypothetical protein